MTFSDNEYVQFYAYSVFPSLSYFYAYAFYQRRRKYSYRHAVLKISTRYNKPMFEQVSFFILLEVRRI